MTSSEQPNTTAVTDEGDRGVGRLIRTALANPYLVIVGALVLLVLGVTSYQKIPADLLQNVSLVATGSEQNLAAWRTLDEALRGALQGTAAPRGARGVFLLACAAAVATAAAVQMVLDPQAVALGVDQLLHP